MSKQARKPRVRKDGVKLDLPGDPQAPNTFIDCSSDAEGKLAWYLGYQDLAKFRQFICSFWFLEQWLQCDGWKHGLSHKKAFHLIRERDHAKYFSEDIDLTTNYPIKAIGPDHQRYESEDDICRNYRYAHILISIVRIINAGDILGDDNNKRLERQKAVETQFRHLNSLDLPAIELTDLQFPTLGPFLELGESELEPHNRALMMIRYMNKQATTKLWPKRFWSKTAFTSMLLQPDHGPHWMSRGHQPVTSKAPLIPVIVSGLLPKVFTIKWTRKAKFPGFDDLMAWIDDEGPVLPTDKQPAEKDPRKYNGKQWRDSDWASIQKICSDVEESNLTILLKLRRQHSGEVLFESRDAPLALTSHLIIENNDIQQRLGEASPASEITPVNLELIPDVGNINGTILSRLSTKDRLLPDPIKEYPVDQYQDMVTHHSGRDAHTDIGKIQWQHFALEEVTQAMPTAVFRTRSSRVSSGEELDRETLALLNESREMGERNAMSHDSESDMQRFYDIHGIFAGSNTQIGLAVDLAKLVLGFESVSQNDASDETEPIRSKCTLFKIGNKEDLTFFDWQVNGACQMLLRTLGYVPLPAAHKTRPEVKSALGRLSCLAVHGGILADQTGLGKTKQTLLFLSYYTQFHIEMHDQSPVHRPILLVVPSQVVKQWADDIIDYFPDFNLLISYDPTVLGHKFFGHTVGSVAMGELPAHDANSNFPQRWTFLFDTQDPRASKTILLTSYDTHAERSIIEELLPSTKRRKNDGAEYRYRSRMKDLFAMVILDEGHRMRNTYTKTWASISLLHAKYHWLITATPVVNSPLDMVGQLALLWPSVKAIIKDHPAVESLCNSNSSFIVLERLAAYKDKDPNDIRLLAALDPAHIQALIKSKDIILIREVYHVTDDLLTIRRSASSVLRKSEQGGEIVLKKLMKPFFVRTVTLNLRDNEAEELQWLHRLAARKYYSMLRGWEQKSGAGTLPPTTLGPNQAKAMYLPIGPLRDMAIASASVLLGRFNLFICQAGFKTLVDDLALYREYGFAARWFIQFVWRDGDPILKTRLDMLRYLCYGSPTLRQILYDVLTYVLPTISEDGEKITRGEKLIIPEATPIVAYFWEFCLRFVYVHATVLHSGLSNSRRQELMDDFNDPEGKTQVLIIMHDVSCQGINIHYDCHRITIPTCPRSASLEFQIWGRVLRVMQKHDVFITRTHVVNTHDTWRESKQTDKASIELASRANHPKVKELLVKLLNENQYEVKNVHDAMKGEYFRSYAGIEEAKQVVGLHISVDSGNNHDEYDDDEHDDDEHGDYDDDDDDDGDDDRDQDYVPSEDEGVQDTESDTVQSPLWPSKKRTDDREMLDPDLSALEAMLKLPYDYTYTTDDLDQPQTFIRAIKLLYNARMGRAGSASRTTLHLRYDQLHESVVESIGRKMKLDENDVATLHVMLQKREQFSANLKKAAKRAKGASSGKGTNKRSSPLSTAQEGTGSLKPQAKKLKQSSIGENRQVTAEGAEEAEGVEGVEGAEGVAMAEMVKEATAMEE